MEFGIGLFLLLVATIAKRFLLPFLIVSVVLILLVGGIAAISGGHFWLAAKCTSLTCLGLGLFALFITTIEAIRTGF